MLSVFICEQKPKSDTQSSNQFHQNSNVQTKNIFFWLLFSKVGPLRSEFIGSNNQKTCYSTRALRRRHVRLFQRATGTDLFGHIQIDKVFFPMCFFSFLLFFGLG